MKNLDRRCEKCGESLGMVEAQDNFPFWLVRPLRATKCKFYTPGCAGICYSLASSEQVAFDKFTPGTQFDERYQTERIGSGSEENRHGR